MADSNPKAPEVAPAATGLGSPATASPQNVLYTGAVRLKSYASSVFQQSKPWTEAFDRTSFSKPENFGEAWTRIRKNGNYFKVNYFILTLVTLAICFIMNPRSLLTMAFLLGSWLYMFVIRTAPLVIGGRTFSEREKLLGMSAITAFVIVFFTSVVSVVLSAVTLSIVLIGVHGALRTPDDLFLDDAGQQQTLLGFLQPPVTMIPGIATTVATAV